MTVCYLSFKEPPLASLVVQQSAFALQLRCLALLIVNTGE